MTTRTSILDMNGETYVSRGCSLCNMGAKEDSYHYLCVCPVRLRLFCAKWFSFEDHIGILDGRCWYDIWGLHISIGECWWRSIFDLFFGLFSVFLFSFCFIGVGLLSYSRPRVFVHVKFREFLHMEYVSC